MTVSNCSPSTHQTQPRKDPGSDPAIGIRLEALLKESHNERTEEFLKSIQSWYKTRGGLSPNQLASFERIESRFSPGEKLKLKEWREEYRQNYLPEAKILASYYLVAGYYTQVASLIMNDSEYVPARHKYFKMANNKYAQSVLHNYHSEPKFDKGVMVQVRASAGKSTQFRHLQHYHNRLGFVIDNSLAVLTATKGGKRYSILPCGHGAPLVVEERHIMKPNKRGQAK